MKPTRCTPLLSIFISTFLHVSGNCVPIIRRTCCVYVSVWVAVWSAGCRVYLFQLLYMFRATVCLSSGELAVSTYLYGWMSGLQAAGYIYFNFSTCFRQLCAHHQENLLYLCVCMGGCPVCCYRPDSHRYSYIDTVSSPDDGHIVVRSM